jgi:hypothetical protein
VFCFSVGEWVGFVLGERIAEDAMEVAMEVDEPQQATKLTAAVKGKGKMCGISQQQLTGGPWLRTTDPLRLQMLLPTQISLTRVCMHTCLSPTHGVLCTGILFSCKKKKKKQKFQCSITLHDVVPVGEMDVFLVLEVFG